MECSRCGHSGAHAQTFTREGGGAGRCDECPECQAENAAEKQNADAAKAAEEENDHE